MLQPSRIVSAIIPGHQANPRSFQSKESGHGTLWQTILALATVYVCWSTTYLAIKIGVKDLPPGLFGGIRVTTAGLCLLTMVSLMGGRVLPDSGTWRGLFLVGTLLFVGGNGLITMAEQTVDSGVAAIIVATVPLFMALMESATPGGERLRWLGWIGQIIGISGVTLLFSGRTVVAHGGYSGVALVVASAFCWSLGSFLQRRLSRGRSPYGQAGWHMVLGGVTMTLIGLASGETVSSENLTHRAIGAFFYLLVVGSLLGFVAYVWLLRHVGTTIAGTYAYVNPVLAVGLGVFWDNEPVGWTMIGGLAVILLGVGLVRMGRVVVREAVGS